MILGKTDGRGWTEIARAAADFDPGAEQRLRVTALGDRFTIALGGRLVLEATDATYDRGTVGLRVVDSQARFADLQIRSAGSDGE